MIDLNSNVEGYVKEVEHTENGSNVIVLTEDGNLHKYGSLLGAYVQKHDYIGIGDPLGFIDGEMHYSVKAG